MYVQENHLINIPFSFILLVNRRPTVEHLHDLIE